MWSDPRIGFRETLLEQILTDGGKDRWFPPTSAFNHPRTSPPGVDARAMGLGFFDASAMQGAGGAGDFGNVAFGEGQGCQGCQGFGWEQMAGGFASQYLGTR